MGRAYKAFKIEKVVPLRDKDYYWFVLEQIRSAKKRIWASIFLIDVYRSSDPFLEVRTLVKELAYAKKRGVNVRLITGRSTRNPIIREMNMITRTFMRTKGLTVRYYRDAPKPRIHDKFVIFDDDLFVLGSHNWMSDGFNESAEDSVAVYSLGLTKRLEQEFLSTWEVKKQEDKIEEPVV